MAASPTVWVVIAHGSRNPELGAAHAEVCERIAGRAGETVEVLPAYLELTEPSIPDAIDGAVARGARSVVLVPYFLHVGNHTGRDIPALAEEARRRHPSVQIAVAEHLGIDDRLVGLVVDRARAAEPRGADQA